MRPAPVAPGHVRRARTALAALLLGAGALCGAGRAAAAQAPDASWRTFTTEHFRVHFTTEVETLARRAAGNAERAYRQLAAELPSPRGPIDLVIADNVDYSNGNATPFPSNRIVIFAHPPVDALSLRFYDDWSTLVVTHELAHIFHLDRTRGWWRVAQGVFGRSPFLFPNQYLPAWAIEGIAVYYESRLTGSGRIVGAQHRAMVRAAAREGVFPGVYDLSLTTSRFPGGEQVYAFGGGFVDHLARTRGADRVPAFIDAVAVNPIPYLLGVDSRRGFGVSLRRAWKAWADSLAAGESAAETTPYATIVGGERQLRGPRWLGDDTLVVGLNDGRDTPGAYSLALDGRLTRLGRRNDASPQVPLADGGLLYAQLDYTDPYRLRSDLYLSRDGRETRLTTGARLLRPDARADGGIVAVQAVQGTTRLVRVSPSGDSIAGITPAVADTQWSEPRWSPDGTMITAIRWRSGGVSDVVVLDSLGESRLVVASGRSVQSSPSWSPAGDAIYYASDSSGTSELYRVVLPPPIAGAGGGWSPMAERLSTTATALMEPVLSPDSDRLAAVRYDARGWEVVVAGLGRAIADGAAASAQVGAAEDEVDAPQALPPAPPATQPARDYSPWPTLIPRYWVPLLRMGDRDETFVGASTSATDVIGRHSYAAEAFVGASSGLVEGSLVYRYAGLGRPVLDGAVVQDWQRVPLIRRDGSVAGERRRLTRTATMSATFQRPRVRTNAWASVGAEVERRVYSTDPAPLLALLDSFFQRPRTVPALRLRGGWSNAQRPLLSISLEDGVSLAASVGQRWLDGDVSSVTRSATGTLSGYRSIPWLPGFAHHVLAVRVAGGWADDAATSEFEAGGVSGGVVEVFPGLVVGEGQRTFGVRGFPAGTLNGTRAAAGTVEYRAPLAAPGRGIAPLPLFVDRASLVLFADGASAWCPGSAIGRPACVGSHTEARWLTSAGAELNVDLAVQYDVGYRGRVGVAFPRASSQVAPARGARLYVAVGRAF